MIDKVQAPLVVLALGALVTACPASSLSPTFTIFHGPPATPNQLARQVALIADSHAHYLYGKPTVIQTNVADWFSATAIRPPQADLWGWRFLRWTLNAIHDDVPIIHLGDVDDISCAAEFARFTDEMARHGRKRWVFAPGNHDGFFYGNYFGDQGPGSPWSKACAGSAPLDKTGVVLAYLEALKKQGDVSDPDPGMRQFAAQRRDQTDGRYRYARTANEYAFLQRASWHVDGKARWHSWVAQEVDLSWSEAPGAPPVERVYAILIDTAAYSKPPALIPLDQVPIAGTVFAPNAGLEGEIPADELAEVSGWLADAKKEGAIVVMAGHHPFSSLIKSSREALGSLRQTYAENVVLYASAHDHSGKWIVDSDGKQQFLELNIGSLLDAPMEFRYLQLLRSADTSGRIGVYSQLVRLADRWRQLTSPAAPHCDDHTDWEPVRSAFPIGYKQVPAADVGKTEDEILRVLLASFAEEVAKIPSRDPGAPWTDVPDGPHFDGDAAVAAAIGAAIATGTRQAKLALALSLAGRVSARFPDEKTPEGTLTRDFEMCQVLWGSKYERSGARKPDADDTTILLPPVKP